MPRPSTVKTTAPPDAVAPNVVLHIVRKRTPERDTVLEALEIEAEKSGTTMGALAMVILAAHPAIRKRIGSK